MTKLAGGKNLVLLIVEDDEDDYLFISEAVKECNPNIDVRWAKCGEEALDYLFRKGNYTDSTISPSPDLIFLDIRMPRMDGLEVCQTIKGDSHKKNIPVIMLTTSNSPRDVTTAYEKGANSYITKPVGADQIAEFRKVVCFYWSSVVLIP